VRIGRAFDPRRKITPPPATAETAVQSVVRIHGHRPLEERRMDDKGISPSLGNGMAGPPSAAGVTDGNGRLPLLPRGLVSFPDIRERGCIYVDKTKYIAEFLAKNQLRVFCARPRRFGKTLMLSTIETLFSEKPEHRALFDGLDIAPYLSEQNFEPRPVLHLDMSRIGIDDSDSVPSNSNIVESGGTSSRINLEILNDFKGHLKRYIQRIARGLNVEPTGESAREIFGNLIEDLSRRKGKIVLLVDEYDCHLLQSMTLPEIQNDIRKILRNFYIQVKSNSNHIYFTFFTGIAKFSNVGIFSEINDLDDISINKESAAMYGYTESEVEYYFKDYIEKLVTDQKISRQNLLSQIKDNYDGYTFDGHTHVYNPLTLERFFAIGDFRQYWVQTGRQLFVEEYLYKKPIRWEELEDQVISKIAIMSPRNVGMDSDPKIVLYQSGYMTIREIPEDNVDFKLTYPNHEVKAAMAAMMANNYFDSMADADAARTGFRTSIASKNYKKIITIFNNMFSNIYKSDKKVIKGKNSKEKEDFFRGHIKTFLHGAEFFAHGEIPSNEGRSDVVAIRGKNVLVIEVKYVDIEPKEIHNNVVSQYTIESDCRGKLQDAISQLYNKNYFDSYDDPLHLAIVIDESRAARISHAAYNETAFHLYGKKPDFIEIGKVVYDGLIWKLSYTSEITASKKPLSPADILAITMSKKAKGTKKTHSKKTESSVGTSLGLPSPTSQGYDTDAATADLILIQSIMPMKQNSFWVEALKGPDSDMIIDHIRRLKLILTKTQSASFWHSLSQEDKLTAFQNAIRTGVQVTLRYITPDGTFFLTAIDVHKREAIGLFMSPTHQYAYGPYPLSRLLVDGSELLPPGTETPLKYICAEQFIDKDASLPTPEQLLKWNEK
jgi:hypothetical protein